MTIVGSIHVHVPPPFCSYSKLLDFLNKDISIIDQLGKDLSVNLPLTKTSKKLYDELKKDGKEMDDMAGIIQIIEKQ